MASTRHSNYIAPQTIDAKLIDTPYGPSHELPMLAALPAQRTNKDWGPLMRNQIDLPANWRTLDREMRVTVAGHAVDEMFSPLGIHVDLGLAFDDILRRGYHRTAPNDIRFNKRVRDTETKSHNGRRAKRPSSLGMSLIGEPGSGKSVSVNQVVQSYSQVIRHAFDEYHGALYLQLVHLTLPIPSDASVRTLCVNFVLALDEALGTEYAESNKIDRKTAGQLLGVMARLAVSHSLGVLILDDLQNLSPRYSGGKSTLAGSLVQFTDRLRIPIVVVGTPDAEDFLRSFPHLHRRAKTHALRWESAQLGAGWSAFVQSLWKCSTLRQRGTPSLRQINGLRGASEGNFHDACERFLSAVRSALYLGNETLTDSCFD